MRASSCFAAVVERGKPAWREVVGEFGDAILHDDGSIDRAKLASIMFNSEERRHALNRCTHPYIRRAVIIEIVKNFIRGTYIERTMLC